MFDFKIEPDLALLTVTRAGLWSLSTVSVYEAALRQELAALRLIGPQTSFIIDIRASPAQTTEVADALRAMVERLGYLNADRTAVVAASGVAKLEAKRVAQPSSRVFPSMVLARDWVMRRGERGSNDNMVHSVASEAEADGHTVHIHGPSTVDINLTPRAALETAKRIGDAAVEALLH